MKKPNTLATKLISLCLVLVTLLTITPAAFAVDVNASAYSSENQISPRIDETGWYYRVVDGVAQKRLWSYTEGKWLTDWIVIGTV